jgi:hypothetical protein
VIVGARDLGARDLGARASALATSALGLGARRLALGLGARGPGARRPCARELRALGLRGLCAQRFGRGRFGSTGDRRGGGFARALFGALLGRLCELGAYVELGRREDDDVGVVDDHRLGLGRAPGRRRRDDARGSEHGEQARRRERVGEQRGVVAEAGVVDELAERAATVDAIEEHRGATVEVEGDAARVGARRRRDGEVGDAVEVAADALGGHRAARAFVDQRDR